MIYNLSQTGLDSLAFLIWERGNILQGNFKNLKLNFDPDHVHAHPAEAGEVSVNIV